MKGYIYLLVGGGFFKIGKSIDATQRVRQLSLPFTVTVLHTIAVEHMASAERHLHQRFAAKQLRGEWFALTEQDVAEFCALTGADFRTPKPKVVQHSLPTERAIVCHFAKLRAAKSHAVGRHISIREIAQTLKVSPNLLRNMEHNRLLQIPHRDFERVCRYLGCSVRDILTME